MVHVTLSMDHVRARLVTMVTTVIGSVNLDVMVKVVGPSVNVQMEAFAIT